MIINESEIHQTTWIRMIVVCALLQHEIDKAEDRLENEEAFADKIFEDDLKILRMGNVLKEVSSADRIWSGFVDARYYLRQIRETLISGKSENLREHFNSFFEAAYEGRIDLEYYQDEIEQCLTVLEIDEGNILYVPDQPIVEVPKLIIPVSDELLRLLARNPDLLFSLHPRKFEEVVAEIFFRNGFEVELTKSTRDGGKDIIAVFNKMNISTKYIIECKRYAKKNKVSLGLVQRLLGVKISTSANKAILATTSTFTRDAIAFTSNYIWDLELKDYDDIVLWLKSCT